MSTKKNTSFNQLFSKKWFVIALIVITVGGGMTAAYLYGRRTQLNAANTEDVQLLSTIKKIMMLPNATPQISTVTNLASYSDVNPDFIKDAAVGDKIIEYATIALLFDPQKNVIKNVYSNMRGALNRAELGSMRVALRYSGDATDGALEQSRLEEFKASITQSLPQLSISEVAQSKANYGEDVIYVINKSKKADALRFADYIGGSPVLETVEPGESMPDADIIVAFGSALQQGN